MPRLLSNFILKNSGHTWGRDLIKLAIVGDAWVGGGDIYLPYLSTASLLDFDIIVLSIPVGAIEGDPSNNDRAIAHWSKEVSEAFDHGKTVVVISRKPYSYTFSGSAPRKGYEYIPLMSLPTRREGIETVAGPHFSKLKDFWGDFQKHVSYEVVLTGEWDEIYLRTKTGGHPVSGQKKIGDGVLIALPNFEGRFPADLPSFERVALTRELREKFVSHLVNLHTRRLSGQKTPAPEWSLSSKIKSQTAKSLTAEAEKIRATIEKNKIELIIVEEKIDEANKFVDLILETGSLLEVRILEALRAIGFKAENYTFGDMEMDVVGEADGKRIIGEVEGRDNKAIGSEKINQLLRNVNEDFSRDEITEMAKPVLFGNAQRLIDPADRSEFFTDKVLVTAMRNGVALVRTTDLLRVMNRVADGADQKYLEACRSAIFESTGIVSFPA
jgi:hypothetical protein